LVDDKTKPHTAIPGSLAEVKIFFVSKKSSEREAEKFFYHYESNGWKTGGGVRMADWQAAAQKWMLTGDMFGRHTPNSKPGDSSSTDKNYGEPL
jgi:hypothetical protein